MPTWYRVEWEPFLSSCFIHFGMLCVYPCCCIQFYSVSRSFPTLVIDTHTKYKKAFTYTHMFKMMDGSWKKLRMSQRKYATREP